MIVQHNMQAMNANRMLGITNGCLSKSTEKLSSGYRVNRAADDAAGLTISEKMRKQIRGLDQASTNAEDGISCVQTAEGALTEVHSMLQRMNELAVQASNGTMSEDDRQAIQDEIDQLVTEIDRVSETTKFNETYLLKGDGEETVTEKINATPLSVKYVDGRNPKIELKTGQVVPGDPGATDADGWFVEGGTGKLDADGIINLLEVDKDGNVVLKDNAVLFKKAAAKSTEFGNQTTANRVTDADVQALYGASSQKLFSDNTCTTEITDEDLSSYFNEDGFIKTAVYAIDANGNKKAVGEEFIEDFVDITPAADEKEVSKLQTKAMEFSLHVGSESDKANKINVKIDSMSAAGIGVDVLKTTGLMTEKDATASIDVIGAAVRQVSKQRSDLGAVQNRLEHTIANLDNVVENTTAAESRIRDLDMAEEMVAYSKNNILLQAGQSMLAQANQATQGVLSLLQ